MPTHTNPLPLGLEHEFKAMERTLRQINGPYASAARVEFMRLTDTARAVFDAAIVAAKPKDSPPPSDAPTYIQTPAGTLWP